MKYKKMAKVNEMASLARALSVKCRVSPFGISIVTKDDAKFFSSDDIYLHPNKCIKYIKEKAHPSLQTTLI